MEPFCARFRSAARGTGTYDRRLARQRCSRATVMNCLVPAILFAIISTVAVSLANGVNLLTSFLAVLAVLASLQCGYVGGLVAAYFVARIKLPHRAERTKFWRPSQFY